MSSSTRLSPSEIAAIKATNPVEALVESRIHLSRPNARGISSGMCLCKPVRGKAPFWVNTVNNTWGCLRGGCGGDVFGYLRQFEGLDFASAVQRLGGCPVVAQSPAVRQRKEREQKRIEREKLEKERSQAFKIWNRGRPSFGTIVEAYFRHRGFEPLTTNSIHFAPTEPYYAHRDPNDDQPIVLWTGPAMVAAIVGPDRRFMGVHRTWLDPRLATGELPATASGKAVILGPDGDPLPVKKMRGQKKGGAIRLNDPRYDCRRILLLIGGGIETTATALQACQRHGAEGDCYVGWAAGDLGNVSGAALGPSEPHPDKPGHWIPSSNPNPDGPGLMPPEWADLIVLLGDGDSDALVTRARLECARRRYAAAGFKTATAMAPEGADFNDVARGGRVRQGADRSALKERGGDLYETPACATLALMQAESLPHRVWESAAGRSAIARELEAAGHAVAKSDLVAHPGADDGIVTPVDFLLEPRSSLLADAEAIVTNPPYKNADAFIRRGLFHFGLPVIVLLRLAALGGANRSDLVDRHLVRVWAGIERCRNFNARAGPVRVKRLRRRRTLGSFSRPRIAAQPRSRFGACHGGAGHDRRPHEADRRHDHERDRAGRRVLHEHRPDRRQAQRASSACERDRPGRRRLLGRRDQSRPRAGPHGLQGRRDQGKRRRSARGPAARLVDRCLRSLVWQKVHGSARFKRRCEKLLLRQSVAPTSGPAAVCRIEFHPEPHNAAGTPGYLPLWRGFAFEPKSKTNGWKTFRDHLLVNVCSGDESLFEWVLGFFAHIVQRPPERLGVALVLQGRQGSGKTIVGQHFGALFPAHYFLVDDPRYVVGNFNVHMANCLLLQADEAVGLETRRPPGG